MMKKVRITAVRKVQHEDLMAQYENPTEHACDVTEGQWWTCTDGQCPDGLCPEAWKSMKVFVEALARGEGNFFDGWMKNPYSAMISCNDGFRPVSFYIEVIEDGHRNDTLRTGGQQDLLGADCRKGKIGISCHKKKKKDRRH